MAVASATTSSGLKAPSSTFAELLRRSRFSSYDPSIAQTYTSPPAYARRGNYGLKRSIPMPYKDSYISLPTFEHHAHFTEWNNAETQVKFVKRVEEMGVLPRYLPGSSWEKGLGEARTQWLIDSEFAEHTSPSVQTQTPAPPQPPKVDTVDTLDAYGKQGPGGYGPKRPPPKSLASASGTAEPDGNHLQVNIESLSPKQFQRYLEKIRQLGPEFREYLFDQQCSRVEAQLRASARAQELPEPSQEEIKAKIKEDELLLFIASQNSSQKLHRRFLSKTFAKDYNNDPAQPSYDVDNNAPAKIEAQPHRNGALTYTHFSPLDSLLTTPPQPGLVLQPEPKGPQRGFYNDAAKRGGYHHQDQKLATYIALFGGLTAKLHARNAGVKVPLYNPEKYLRDDPTAGAGAAAVPVKTTPEALEKSTGMFRMTRIAVRAPPKVVGYAVHKKRPKALLDEMSLDTECVTELPWSQRNLVNPYRPGSYEYSAHQQVTVHNRMLGAGRYSVGNVIGGGGAGGGRGAFSYSKLREKDRENSAKKALRGWGGGNGVGGADQEFGKSMAKTLSGIVNSAGRGSE